MLTLALSLALSLAPAATPVAARTAATRRVIRQARSMLGRTYVFGDAGTAGYDCSSMVQAAFKRYGYLLPRTSREQAAMGEPVARDAIEPGDLLFFTASPKDSRVSHVGIALDRTHMIHAARQYHRVVISRWDQRYFQQRWFAARRILAASPASEPGDGNLCDWGHPGVSYDPAVSFASN